MLFAKIRAGGTKSIKNWNALITKILSLLEAKSFSEGLLANKINVKNLQKG